MNSFPATFDHLSFPSRDALKLLGDMGSQGGPSRLKRTTPAPSRQHLTLDLTAGPVPTDLYLPQEAPRSGLLLVPGVARGGKDDPRLIRFAGSLARLGFAVLVPQLESLKDLSVRPVYTGIVRDAFRVLAEHPVWSPGGRAGIGGLSFAMGPGVMAAVTPGVMDKVRFVFCIGGYYDLLAQTRFVTTGQYRVPLGSAHEWQRMEPDPYGRWVLAASLVPHVEDLTSRAAIQGMIDRREKAPLAEIDDLVAQLRDPEARALFDFIQNRDPGQYDALFTALPTRMVEDLHALNVAACDLSGIRARLILVHGYEDDLIHLTHSLGLHQAAPVGQSRLYLVRGLRHVTMLRPSPLGLWRLVSAIQALLEERGAPGEG
ncbi:MAG: alpha/beta hydrolase [Candidatus Sericytochromatia bacterium]|nr:alpha/beta hydrolase [Candidatus Sericytochromatia bacterium]